MINFYSEYTVFAQDLTQHFLDYKYFYNSNIQIFTKMFLFVLISTKVSREHNKGEKVSLFTKPLGLFMDAHWALSIKVSLIVNDPTTYSTTQKTALSGHTVDLIGIFSRQYPISLRMSLELILWIRNKVDETVGKGFHDLNILNFFKKSRNFILLLYWFVLYRNVHGIIAVLTFYAMGKQHRFWFQIIVTYLKLWAGETIILLSILLSHNIHFAS